MRNPRFLLAFTIIIGAMGVLAFIAPVGVKPALADNIAANYTGNDLKNDWHSFVYNNSYGIGIPGGCSAATWSDGLGGWINSPGCGSNYYDGQDTRVWRNIRLTLVNIPPTVHVVGVHIVRAYYNPNPQGGDKWRDYAIVDGTGYAMSNETNAFYSFPAPVTSVVDLVFFATADIVVSEIDLMYYTDNGTTCANLCIPVSSGGGGGPGSAGSCQTCVYAPSGDITQDLPRLVEYLDCYLGNLYFCWLNQTLALIFRYILYIVLLLQSVIIWGISQADALLIWLVNALMACLMWIGGMMQNMTNQGVEATYFARGGATTIVTGGSSNIWDVLIAFVNGLGSVLNGITSGLTSIINGLTSTLSNLITQLGSIIVTALNGTFGVILALINAILQVVLIVIQVLGVVVVAVIQLIEMVVSWLGAIVIALIGGILGGFQATVTNPLTQISGLTTMGGSGVSSVSSVTGMCSNNIVIHLCIGAYILDNTIFSGNSPVSLGFFIISGIIWFDRIVWAVTKFGKVNK